MALYTIGDLHLSLGSDKPMEVFGEGWSNYVERIREGFAELTAEDVAKITDITMTETGLPASGIKIMAAN